MTIEEIQEPTSPGGYEGYTKLLARVNRSRKAAKYESLSPDVKFNMYLYGLIRNPKYKELMIKKAGTDKDAFETPWMKKVLNEYYTSTIISPAAMAKSMQQPGLMTNKSMSQKNNQTTTQVIKQEGSINWPHREKRKRRKKEQRRKSPRNANTATKFMVGNAGLLT